MRDPQDQDHQVQAVLYRAHRPDVGEPLDQPLGLGRIRSHERDHYDEDENEEDAAEGAGQATRSQNASLGLHPLQVSHPFVLPVFELRPEQTGPSMAARYYRVKSSDGDDDLGATVVLLERLQDPVQVSVTCPDRADPSRLP